jgi:hypothetical protein
MAQSWSKDHPSEASVSILGVIRGWWGVPCHPLPSFLRLNVKFEQMFGLFTKSLSNCYQNTLETPCICYTKE